MKKLLPFILVLLVGCSVDNSPSQHSYTTEQYDPSTNVTLLPSAEMYISFEQVIALHKDMQACLGLTIDPTTDETVIMFRSFENHAEWFTRDTGGVVPYLGGGYGLYMNLNGIRYVFINTDLDKEPHLSSGFYRDAYTDSQTVKHEFIHTINSFNGISGHGDEFTRCDAWPNVQH